MFYIGQIKCFDMEMNVFITRRTKYVIYLFITISNRTIMSRNMSANKPQKDNFLFGINYTRQFEIQTFN